MRAWHPPPHTHVHAFHTTDSCFPSHSTNTHINTFCTAQTAQCSWEEHCGESTWEDGVRGLRLWSSLQVLLMLLVQHHLDKQKKSRTRGEPCT